MLVNKKLEEILAIVREEFIRRLGSNVVKIKLYGSYARGDFDTDSDIDIMILIRDNNSKELHEIRTEIAHQILLDFGVLVSIVFIEETHFYEWFDAIPLYQNVENEGISIYG